MEEVAEELFNATGGTGGHLLLPSDCCPHSFPFLSGDTLRAAADVAFERVTVVSGIYYLEKWDVAPKGW